MQNKQKGNFEDPKNKKSKDQKEKEKGKSQINNNKKKFKCGKNKSICNGECCSNDFCSRIPKQRNSQTCCESTPLIDTEGYDWCCPSASK